MRVNRCRLLTKRGLWRVNELFAWTFLANRPQYRLYRIHVYLALIDAYDIVDRAYIVRRDLKGFTVFCIGAVTFELSHVNRNPKWIMHDCYVCFVKSQYRNICTMSVNWGATTAPKKIKRAMPPSIFGIN